MNTHKYSLTQWIADRREVLCLPLGILTWAILAVATAMIASWGR